MGFSPKKSIAEELCTKRIYTMTIYQKMEELTEYFGNVVKPFIQCKLNVLPVLSSVDKDNIRYDIDNYMLPIEHGEKDLYALCNSYSEENVVNAFYDEILFEMINNVNEIITKYFTTD